jgi:hypothetical protein
MLYRHAGRAIADAREEQFALGAVVARHAHLDQFMCRQRNVDFVQHGRRQAMVADGDDRTQVVSACAQLASENG